MKCIECEEHLKQIRENVYYCDSAPTVCTQSTKIVNISK